MSFGPFDLTGGPFLGLYVILFAATIAAGYFIPRWMRPLGREQRVEDLDALALLAGGSRRFRKALVARLVSARALVSTGRRRFRIGLRPQTATPAETNVLRLRPPIRRRDIGDVLGLHEEILERRMIASGLIIDKAEQARIRFRATLPYVALLTFGGTEWVSGEAPPSALLAALLMVTALLAIIRWARIDRCTRAGRTAVAVAKRKVTSLRIAPTRDDAALAVALFGAGALAGSGWWILRPGRKTAGSDDGSPTGGLTDLIDGLMDLFDHARDWVGSGGSDGAGCGGGCGGGGCGG